MKTKMILIVIMFILFGVVSAQTRPIFAASVCDNVNEIPVTECQALESLYNGTTGSGWKNHQNWLVTTTPCSWYGVVCSGGHVTEINLGENQLNGTMPTQIGNFANLTKLNLYKNVLRSSVPAELSSLRKLQTLNLSNNQFSGALPDFSSISTLTNVYFNNNRLSGNIPSSLGTLSNLSELYLNDNQFNGSIPPELANLQKETVLDLSRNSLTGAIPSQFGTLTSIKYLGLGSNQLSGAMPSELGNLTNLIGLYLQDNQLSGNVPAALGNLANLTDLWLDTNALSGALPQELTKLTKLTTFYFDNTSLCEPSEATFQSWLTKITNLRRTKIACTATTPTATSVNVTVTPSNTPVKTPNATGTPGGNVYVYLPLIIKSIPPTSTPTSTPTNTPQSPPTHTPTPTSTGRVIRVATNGQDSTTCGTETAPCQTIQQAVSLVNNGDTASILVAVGSYTYNSAKEACSQYIGATAVVCILNKKLILRGGYTSDNWTVPNPEVNKTIIDGQNQYRGILVQRTAPSAPETAIHLEGFIVQNGLAQGNSSGSDDKTFAFGGGMLTDASLVTIKYVTFKNNKAMGGNTNSPYGGTGSGGGLALRTAQNSITLEYVFFEGNEAHGGSGLERGGFAIGGGLYTYRSTVEGNNLTFTNNKAVGGYSNGSGINNGWLADAQGGGGAFQQGSTVTLENVEATGNVATGGQANNGKAGGAFGGALFSEGRPQEGLFNSVTLRDANIRNNQAVGGQGGKGGHGAGGGLQFDKTSIFVERVYVINNQSIGGTGSAGGPAGGGGVYLQNLDGSQINTTILNTIIADNTTRHGAGYPDGGGGGGLWLQGISSADIIHTTFANNQAQVATGQAFGYMQGAAILLLNDGAATASNVNLSYSIIANHSDSQRSAIHVKPGNTLTLNKGLFAGNGLDTNVTGLPDKAGTFNGLNSMLKNNSAGFTSTNDYHITSSSAAKDQATGSTTSVDIDNQSRNDGKPDIGADEY